jgi:uncharacterized protein YbbC (DUF1343 family)/CubicO group peptidase (beta-lactamase class C family)
MVICGGKAMNKIKRFLVMGTIVLLVGTAAAKDKDFSNIDSAIQDAIAKKQIPGAVVLIGHDGEVVYHKAYGNRALEPVAEPMTEDTIFDIASLTKIVATTTSVMKLVQEGKIKLNDPVSRYVPEFGLFDKQDITVRHLLTHYSGMAPDLDLRKPWQGKDTAFRMIVSEKPALPPGSRFVYSDINFEMLGFVVERVTGMPLNEYAAKEVFEPLGMKETGYLPNTELLPRIAPTQYDDNHVMLRGVVHDPTARRMGGVAGHAGVFSTAADLARFAQNMLSDDPKVLTQAAIEKMTTPQQPPTSPEVRGFGWDIDTPFASNRGELLPVGSFGHTGFTGTSLWIDPYTKTYIILLTNAVHPNGPIPGGGIVSLRTRVATAVVDALDLKLSEKALHKVVALTGYNEAASGSQRTFYRNGHVLNGIDVLIEDGFKALQQSGKTVRVGLLTNQTGLTLNGVRTIDALAHAPGIQLAAIFSPEHGAVGALDTTSSGDTRDPATGVPVYSMYGAGDAARRPKQEILKQLDAVVIDIQDVGARFYTYESSMGYMLEAAVQAGIRVYVLDRPNPISGIFVQGPVSDVPESFVNYSQVPIRHGMTMGELARMYNAERKIGAKLNVVEMRGWMRGDWFDSTGEAWVNPSPNMRNLNQATLYTGVAVVEYTNVSVGRGTDTPFELLGAPWIHARDLADYLNSRYLSGVRFVPVSFTPASGPYAKQQCQGVNIIVVDRARLDAPELGVELASALLKLYPRDYDPHRMPELLGNSAAYSALLAGQDPRRIAADWREDLVKFEDVRAKYLLYH